MMTHLLCVQGLQLDSDILSIDEIKNNQYLVMKLSEAVAQMLSKIYWYIISSSKIKWIGFESGLL